MLSIHVLKNCSCLQFKAYALFYCKTTDSLSALRYRVKKSPMKKQEFHFILMVLNMYVYNYLS